MRRKALKQKKKIGIQPFLESGIHWAGIRNPVVGIRNPERGIQNPRLSWIPLHGAIPFILKLNIYQKADFLLYELIWKTQYFLITYSVHTLNLTWFLKGLCHGSLVHFVYRWQVHILIRYETWEIDACERQNRAKSLLWVHQICLPSII